MKLLFGCITVTLMRKHQGLGLFHFHYDFIRREGLSLANMVRYR